MNSRMTNQVDETRVLIISVARDIFTARGFFDPQMKDIAEAASLSRSSLYRYYADKRDLAIAVFGEVVTDSLATVQPAINKIIEDKSMAGIAKLEKVLLAGWLSPKLNDQFRFIAEFDAFFSGNRVPRDFTQRIKEILPSQEDDSISVCLKQGIEDGSIDPNIDMHLTMVTILNTIRGLRQRMLLREETLIEVKKSERKTLVPELLRILLRGLRP